jgi:phosphoribosylglycinamide formyltransferase-1
MKLNEKNDDLPDGINSSSMKSIAIFASGAGTNAQMIIHRFANHPFIKVKLIVCNKPEAGVLKVASENSIVSLIINKDRFYKDGYAAELAAANIDFIVLAGFLLKVPPALLQAYPGRIINIHPALLPKYGGKGMYGVKVHEAVIAAGDAESGITIHYVDEHFDTGEQILQVKCEVEENDTAESLASKVHELEYQYFSNAIEDCVRRILIQN